MKLLQKTLLFLTLISTAFADNQTPTVDVPVLAGNNLPFQVRIKLADFELPNGFHSGVGVAYQGKWLLLAGRTNGLHGFDNNNNNFPPQNQNTTVYVVDPTTKRVYSRSLTDPGSGLKTWQVDLLSVTSPEFYQDGKTCYMVGGYGVDSATGEFSTKAYLTAINIPKLMRWVLYPKSKRTAANCFRYLANPIFQVTGGKMTKIKNNPTLLIVGQNFEGYYLPTTGGTYTEQIRRFIIRDNGKQLDIKELTPSKTESYMRRRDLNVVPIIQKHHGKLVAGMDILSGVFTPTGGIWTVPVRVKANGKYSMPNPEKSSTFKQGMNNYTCPHLGLYSSKTNMMYTVLFGGISYGFFNNGTFQTDPQLPFTNQVTTIALDKHNNYTQYLMNAEYPTIVSTLSNPGNPLLFGAGGLFMNANNVWAYENEVVKYDRLKNHGKSSVLVGYIIGGIASTLENTNTQSDSTASPYIFKVYLERVQSDNSSSDESDCGCGIILSE